MKILKKQVENPPKIGPEELGKWIKEKASEVKHYLERLSKPNNFENPQKMLKQLSQIRKNLAELNSHRKQQLRSNS